MTLNSLFGAVKKLHMHSLTLYNGPLLCGLNVPAKGLIKHIQNARPIHRWRLDLYQRPYLW